METKERYSRLGRIVKGERITKRWTQKELAEKAGVSAATVNRIKAGNQNPGVEVVRKLAQALDLSLNLLVDNNSGKSLDQKLEELEEQIDIPLFNRREKETYTPTQKKT